MFGTFSKFNCEVRLSEELKGTFSKHLGSQSLNLYKFKPKVVALISTVSSEQFTVFWRRSGGVLAAFWRCSGAVLALFWRCSGGVLAVFWRYSGGVLAVFWRWLAVYT